MAYVVLFSELAFQKTKEDDPHVPDGPETIVKKGDPVPEWVGDAQLTALSAAGMIVMVNDEPAPAPAPEVGPPPPSGPVRPKPADSRGAWEDYALKIGMDEAEVKTAPNKDALIAAVSAFEAGSGQ